MMEASVVLVLVVAIFSCCLQLYLFLHSWGDASPQSLMTTASVPATFDKIFLVGQRYKSENWPDSWLHATSFESFLECHVEDSAADLTPTSPMSVLYVFSVADCLREKSEDWINGAEVYHYFDAVIQVIRSVKELELCQSPTVSCEMGLLLASKYGSHNSDAEVTSLMSEVQAIEDYLTKIFLVDYLNVRILKENEMYTRSNITAVDPLHFGDVIALKSLHQHCTPILLSRKYDARCLPPPPPSMLYPLLITSLGGAGTHKIADELQIMAYHVEHEGLGLDASVSWYYAFNDAAINYSFHYPGNYMYLIQFFCRRNFIITHKYRRRKNEYLSQKVHPSAKI